MTIHPLRLVAAVLCLVAARAAAASDPASAVPPPSAPFVAAVPDRVQWTLTVAGASLQPSSASGPRQIAKVRFAKTGRIAERVITYNDGTNWDVWFANGMELDPNGPEGSILVIAPVSASVSDVPLGSPLLLDGFPGTEWLSAARYDAAVPFRKTICYHYAAPDPHAGGQAEAWIDAATRLPQGFVSQGVTYLYEMQDPPTGALTLPAAYQAAYDQYRKAMERRARLDAGPPR